MNTVFPSMFLAGFECSSHVRRDGRRLDLIAATAHDVNASADYTLVSQAGIRAVRDGVRWHLIEKARGQYDWSSLRPQLQAARDADVSVLWDLCHYGVPDHLDVWSAGFAEAFAEFSYRAARVIRAETAGPTYYCPINEISFWAWAGGAVGIFSPVVHGRGAELKRILVRAAIVATAAIRSADPNARFILAEPLINVIPLSDREEDCQAACAYHESQFEVFDMLSGRAEPDLGGEPGMLDIVGVNFYPDNQWRHGGSTIPLGHNAFRRLRSLLVEVHERYRRPMLISETGAEGSARAAWLHYVAAEVRSAIALGAPVEGICLYPILDYPGWENERHCEVGLFGATVARAVDGELLDELLHQQAIFARIGASDGRAPRSADHRLQLGAGAAPG